MKKISLVNRPNLQIFKMLTKLICIFFIAITTIDAQELISPCPNLFAYDPEGVVNNQWSGTVTVGTDAELSGIWIRIIFDKPFLELGTDFGEAIKREPTEYLIKKPNNKVAAGQNIQFKITAKFNPGESPPKVLGFRLNAHQVCPENGPIGQGTQSVADQLISPCPETFTYEIIPTETDRWYGNLIIKSDQNLSGVWLRIILDRPSMQLGNWFGEVTTEDNKEYLIKNRNHKVNAGEITPIRFFIKYNPAEPVPKLLMYRLNAVQACPGPNSVPNVGPTENSAELTTPSPLRPHTSRPVDTPTESPVSALFGSDFDPNSRPIFLPGRNPVTGLSGRQSCGTVAAMPRPLITYGEATSEGQWPWHAALYKAKTIDLQYICGASLITMRHVLSAAHCVTTPSSNLAADPNEIQVFLGKYHLRMFTNKHIQNMQVDRISIHPEYNYRYFTNDVAILRLSSAAQYTDYVRPVCLWSESNDINNIVNQEGTVVGWGFDQTGKLTESLTKARMPVVTHQRCILSYPEFFSRFANERTFCAGYRNGTFVCNGDSGGGLVFPKSDSVPGQPVWQIRGVVSISVALQGEFVCDSSHYAVFADTAKYLDWIRQIIST